MPTLVLYSYFLVTVSSKRKRPDFAPRNGVCNIDLAKREKEKTTHTLLLFIHFVYYYCYFLSNPILLLAFTLAEYSPYSCRAAFLLPVTGRMKHLGAHPAQLYTCHCPAVCRVLHMAISLVELGCQAASSEKQCLLHNEKTLH